MQVNGTTYYYVTNLQGDVMGLVDTSGNSVASYTYDPYGKVLTATGILAEKNPLRYRGYYYDSESGLYYLQSRYYDPATRRFVNADAYASTGQGIIGTNMFAYCNNDPGNSIDPYGYGYISIGGTSRNNFCELLEDGCSGGGGGAILTFFLIKAVVGAVKYLAEAAGTAIAEISTAAVDFYKNATARKRAKTEVAVASKTFEEYSYWTAEIIDGYVVPLVPLTYEEAFAWAAEGRNLLCKNRAAAIAIVRFFPSSRWEEAHGKRECGYLNHYHLSSAHNNHIWYLGD